MAFVPGSVDERDRAFANSAQQPMATYFLTRFFGLKAFNSVNAVRTAILSTMGALSPPLVGMIYDRTHSYHLAFIPIHVENWVLDHDQGWMILGTPDMAEVHIYTRDPHPPQDLADRLAKEVRDLGYAGELQMPPQTRP